MTCDSIDLADCRGALGLDVAPRVIDTSVFVGRAAPLAHLRAAWADVEVGVARNVWVRGPSGIGKSRLLDRFLEIGPDGGDPSPGDALGSVVRRHVPVVVEWPAHRVRGAASRAEGARKRHAPLGPQRRWRLG